MILEKALLSSGDALARGEQPWLRWNCTLVGALVWVIASWILAS